MALLCAALCTSASCNFIVTAEPDEVAGKVEQPYRMGARLAALWVGHASVLIQIEDKLILTDPVFTDSVGQISKRLMEPGLDESSLPPVDAVLISHVHFDHLSLGTLERIEDRVGALLAPTQAVNYIPRHGFPVHELGEWTSWEDGDGLRVTAVPVKHPGWRYALDAGWMTQASTAYVIEYRGVTVYFGGDTAYHPTHFKRTGERFPGIDLAFLPIGPIEPRDFMKRVHADPKEALQIFEDLGAQRMLPIHFETFINSADTREAPRAALEQAAREAGVGPDRLGMWRIGEQRVVWGASP